MEFVGDTRTSRLEGGAPRGFQTGRLTLLVDGLAEPMNEGKLSSMPYAAANVGGAYTALRDDIAHGTSIVGGFGHAVKLTQFVIDLPASSRTGKRFKAADRPGR